MMCGDRWLETGSPWDGDEMTKEQELAVKSYIRQVQFAIKNAQNEPISLIFACACTGPIPECACAYRDRLVREFMESQNDRA